MSLTTVTDAGILPAPVEPRRSEATSASVSSVAYRTPS